MTHKHDYTIRVNQQDMGHTLDTVIFVCSAGTIRHVVVFDGLPFLILDVGLQFVDILIN